MIRRILGRVLCALGEHDEYIHRYANGGWNKKCARPDCNAVIPA